MTETPDLVVSPPESWARLAVGEGTDLVVRATNEGGRVSVHFEVEGEGVESLTVRGARLVYSYGSKTVGVFRCGHSGGVGIGAGHECRCVRDQGHDEEDPRPHGCGCGAVWS